MAMMAGRSCPCRQSTQASVAWHARGLGEQAQLLAGLVEPVDEQQLAQRGSRAARAAAPPAGGVVASERRPRRRAAAEPGERLAARARRGRRACSAGPSPRGARRARSFWPRASCARGRTSTADPAVDAARRAQPGGRLEALRGGLVAAGAIVGPARRATPPARRSGPAGTRRGAAATRAAPRRRARPSGSGSRARAAPPRPTACPGSGRPPPRRASGVRARARLLARELEGGLGRVRASRPRPAGAARGPRGARPARAAPGRGAPGRGRPRRGRGSRGGTARSAAIASAVRARGEERLAALEQERGRAPRRCARGSRPARADEARARVRAPAGDAGCSRSSRSNAAAAAARSPRASCALPRARRAPAARRGQDATACSSAARRRRAALPARTSSPAPRSSASQATALAGSARGREVRAGRGVGRPERLLRPAEGERARGPAAAVCWTSGCVELRRARLGVAARVDEAQAGEEPGEAGRRRARELLRPRAASALGAAARVARRRRRAAASSAVSRGSACEAPRRERRRGGRARRGSSEEAEAGDQEATRAATSDPRAVGVAPGQDAHQLVVEVVARLAHGGGHAVVVHLPAALDVLLEPLVDVLRLAALRDLRLVVELDLAHHEPREALRVVVRLLVLRATIGARRRRCEGGGGAERAAAAAPRAGGAASAGEPASGPAGRRRPEHRASARPAAASSRCRGETRRGRSPSGARRPGAGGAQAGARAARGGRARGSRRGAQHVDHLAREGDQDLDEVGGWRRASPPGAVSQ